MTFEEVFKMETVHGVSITSRMAARRESFFEGLTDLQAEAVSGKWHHMVGRYMKFISRFKMKMWEENNKQN